MRGAFPAVAVAVALAGCHRDDLRPRVDAVDPDRIGSVAATTCAIEGLFPRPASVSLSSGDAEVAEDAWIVHIAGRSFAAPDVTWIDERRLDVTLPAGMPVGIHDVTVESPDGTTATKAAALRVTDLPPGAALSLETAPGGAGAPITARTLTTDEPLTMYAVARTPSGDFLADVTPLWWSIENELGVITPAGSSATLDPRVPGAGRVRADAEGLAPARTGVLTIVPGRAASFAVAPDGLVIALGEAPASFSIASAVDADGNETLDVGNVEWSISSGSIASIDGATGVFTPASAGAGTIRATSSYGPFDDTSNVLVVTATGIMPRACFTLGATAGTAGVTAFTFDASCSTDGDDPDASLAVRWDFESDGTFDTSFTTAKTASRVFAATGTKTVTVEVLDPGGRTDFTSHALEVHSGNALVVTTALDENDGGATPASPLGTGLSLREAMAWVNATGAARTIVFAGPMTIAHGSSLPTLTAQGAGIVGRSGITLDFDGANGASGCLRLAGPDQRILWLRIVDCGSTVLNVEGARARVAETVLVGRPNSGNGLQLKGTSGVAGPHVDVSGMSGKGISIKGSDNVFDDNVVRGNGVGIDVSGLTGTVVRRNRVRGNADGGISVANFEGAAVITHNVVHGNGGAGISIGASATGIVLRNNLLTQNGTWGIDAPGVAAFASFEPNGFHANASGAISFTSPGAGSVTGDPRYVDPSTGNFRLRSDSPCVNRGADTGLDVNGSAAGRFHSTAPDLGAFETTY